MIAERLLDSSNRIGLRESEERVGFTSNGIPIVIDHYAADIFDMSGLEEIKAKQAEIMQYDDPEERYRRFVTMYDENKVFEEFCKNEASFRALEQIYTRDRVRFNGAVGIDDGGKSKMWIECFENARAVRERKTVTTKVITEQIRTRYERDNNEPIQIFSVASGSARAVLEALKVIPLDASVRARMLDWDSEALEYSKKLAEEFGIPNDRVVTVPGDVVRIRKHFTGQPADIIEAVGIFDYLNDRLFDFVLRQIYQGLKDNGVAIFSNIMPNPESEFLHTAMRWRPMHYRSEDEFAKLIEKAGFQPNKCTLHRIPLGFYSIAEAWK